MQGLLGMWEPLWSPKGRHLARGRREGFLERDAGVRLRMGLVDEDREKKAVLATS